MPADQGPIVDTGAGSVRGVLRGGSAAFLGIPFAEPPVGPLRFQAPEPRAAWEGVRDATAYGPTPQRVPFAAVTTIPEPSIPGDDTLSLNVFTPWPLPEQLLPVVVWIHGGGYVAGSPASPWYDGAAFARDGVLLVTIAYRLGFDGFGRLPGAPDNRGVLDQLLALRWVHERIARFGGDPGRVTVAGQSAGGGAVLSLMTTPAAEGLFQAVASYSGAPADIAPEHAESVTRALAGRLGVEPTLEAFAAVDELRIVRMQDGDDVDAVPSRDRILGTARELAQGRTFGPVVDGELFASSVADAFAAGVGRGLPLLLGATTDEFTAAFLAAAPLLTGAAPADVLRAAGMPSDTVEPYLRAVDDDRPEAVLGRFVTDAVFRTPALQLVRARGAAPTWLYDFVWPSAVSGVAEHCLDVPFVFDVLSDPDVTRVAGPGAPQQLADEAHGALVRFARTGDPGWAAASAGGAARRFGASSVPAERAFASAAALLR